MNYIWYAAPTRQYCFETNISKDPRNSKYSQSSVSLPQYPGLCFFFLDSNEDGAGQRRKGDAEQPRPLTTLSGFTQGILNGNDYGGITMAEYAER